jgi:GNAT superfamily N-acetyltransferase
VLFPCIFIVFPVLIMISITQTRSFSDAILALNMLRDLDAYYPDFTFWFVNRVIPGVVTGDDILIVAKEHGKIVGVGIGKRHRDETKLRCVRVAPSHQKKNLWRRILDATLRALDCDKPICTVPQEMIDDFSRIFINHYRFNLTRVDRGAYRKGINEYRFNDVDAARVGRVSNIFVPYGLPA